MKNDGRGIIPSGEEKKYNGNITKRVTTVGCKNKSLKRENTQKETGMWGGGRNR